MGPVRRTGRRATAHAAAHVTHASAFRVTRDEEPSGFAIARFHSLRISTSLRALFCARRK